jgi:hypothetical protein
MLGSILVCLLPKSGTANLYANGCKMSLRALNLVRNWCFYKINIVHLPFYTVFCIFNHISVIFGPINMFLGKF